MQGSLACQLGVNIYDPKVHCDAISKAWSECEKEKEKYRKEAEKTREEVRKDFEEEITSLKLRLADSIELTRVERERLDAFYDRHGKKCDNHTQIDIHLFFSPIGTFTSVKCPVCGEEENITEYDKA